MRKILLVLPLLLVSFLLQAQDTTHSIAIGGSVPKPYVLTEEELSGFKTVSLDSLVIYNHVMEYKKTMHGIKGVLLKDILQKISIPVTSPRDLSMYYFVVTAKDGYKVVMSWNEIFNSTNRLQPMIVVERDHKGLKDEDDKLALITPGDQATGRRYVKGVRSIKIQKAN